MEECSIPKSSVLVKTHKILVPFDKICRESFIKGIMFLLQRKPIRRPTAKIFGHQQSRSAKSKVLETALHQESDLFCLWDSSNWGWKTVAFALSPNANISSSDQIPTASPAAYAAPRAVVSMFPGLTTALPKRSACKQHKLLLLSTFHV